MISMFQRVQRQRRTGAIDEGFTLIELLIVIIVLGILAAVVVFSLGGVTTKSAVSACKADGATLETAVAAFQVFNPGSAVTTMALTGTNPATGGPYIQTWPQSDPKSFTFYIINGAISLAVGAGGAAPYTGPAACDNVS